MDQECQECKSALPLDDDYFYRDKKLKSGFRKICKICARKYQKGNRSKPVHLSRENLVDYPVFGPFEQACLRDEFERGKDMRYSTDRPV